eukprot:SAG31_NODE_15098_length_771_cov_0.997024_1_plen_209_part_00
MLKHGAWIQRASVRGVSLQVSQLPPRRRRMRTSFAASPVTLCLPGGIGVEFLAFVPVSEGTSGNPGISSHVSVVLAISGALVFDTACSLPHGATHVICNGTLPAGTWNLTGDIGNQVDQPPVVMVHGTYDTVVPYREALAVQARATAANISNLLVSVPRAGHVPYEQLLGMSDTAPAMLNGSGYLDATMEFIYRAMNLQAAPCPRAAG